MIIEDTSTKCPNCKSPLTWMSHTTLWEGGCEVHAFAFLCNSCKREYVFKGDRVTEKRPTRSLLAETAAIHRAEFQDALNRRCLTCGGPITTDAGPLLRCEWCHSQYTAKDGELHPRIEDQLKPRPSMREFYALHH